jgi:exocyst complex component 3
LSQKGRLLEIINDGGLEGQEYVTVLSWIIQTYPGKDLMGDTTLAIKADLVRPLLDPDTILNLQKEYLSIMRKNYGDWMGNTRAQEMEDWKKAEDPEQGRDSPIFKNYS